MSEQNAGQSLAVTVWQDGGFRIWGNLDAHYAEADPDWLCTVPLREGELGQAKAEGYAEAKEEWLERAASECDDHYLSWKSLQYRQAAKRLARRIRALKGKP